MSETPGRGPGTIQSVERALDVLLALSIAPGAGPTSIGAQLGLHKSTVHRLLRSLESRGFVARDSSTDRYRVGPAALQLSQASAIRPDLAAVAQPELTRLRDATSETAILDIRVGSSRMCIAQAESRQEIRRSQPLGSPMEIHAGAMGKVLLMDEPADLLQEIAQRVGFRKLTDHTPVTVDALLAQIHKLHRDGYLVSVGERVKGATTIAAPVRSPSGQVVAAVAVSGPTFRFGVPQARAIVPHLLEASARIAAKL